MLDRLTHDDFQPYLNSSFEMTADPTSPVVLTLVDIRPLGSKGEPDRRRAFSLLFRGPREPLLSQRMYPLRHPRMGRMEVFLVPLGPDEKGMRYEAVFA